MPLHYLRRLTDRNRTQSANEHLARYLAFIAGAVNAGGFLAVGQYTSHMSGIVSAMADNLAVGSLSLVFTGLLSVTSFVFGAFCSSATIRWARKRQLHSEYALPLAIEAALLLIFGLIGRKFQGGVVLGTIMLLCFTMGLQNAMITKISGAVIRTTHLTGMLTDIGIGLGHLVFTRAKEQGTSQTKDITTVLMLSSLVLLFFVGGFTGAIGFKYVGFLFALPLAAILILLAVMPIFDDLQG